MKARLLRFVTFQRPGCVSTLRVRNPPLLLLALLVLIAYLAAPSAVTCMALFTLAGIVLVGAWWTRTLALRVSGRRTLQSVAVQVGDELEEIITLDNASLLPVLWAEFVDRSNLPGYAVSSVRAIEPKTCLRWHTRAVCTRRGVFELGPWELDLGDPFGIFSVRQVYSEPLEVLVYPSLAALPLHLTRLGGRQGDRRLLRLPASADFTNAVTTRPYHAGDPLRHIHWPTTARQGDPFVKVFQPESASHVWLVPDFDSAAQCGDPDTGTEETIVLLAASLAAQLLRQKLAVGLFARSQVAALVPPQRGTAHLWSLLRALAPLRARSVQPLVHTLECLRPLLRAGDHVITITASIQADWSRPLLNLAGSGRGGAQVILLNLESFGCSGPTEPHVRFLADLGLECRVVQKGEIRPIEGAYGAVNRWEFRTLATGGVHVRQSPRRAPSLSTQLGVLDSAARAIPGEPHD